MQVQILKYYNQKWSDDFTLQTNENCLLICFGSKALLATDNIATIIQDKFGYLPTVYCSTSGEIYGTEVVDNSLVVSALCFEKTSITINTTNINQYENSYIAGKNLIEQFELEKLNNVLVFSDGSLVNGSQLVQGMNDAHKGKVLITGGLAGDAANFESTLVGYNNDIRHGNIVAIGFYGSHLKVGHGSQGGWDYFGPERTVTKSKDNVLYEIEGKNALDNYKHYLGPEAENLPAAALLFPLSVKINETDSPIVRTILSIDEENKTMTFAGDLPQGAKVRFMKANFNRISEAAEEAAKFANEYIQEKTQFALLISCVGRKLILESKTSEEVEAVAQSLPKTTAIAGFYSYGEISPFQNEMNCQLHNQTMTITTFGEL